MATPQTSRKKPRKGAAKRRRPTATNQARKPIPLRSEVDEPRPQPPPSEAPAVRDGRNEAARQEALHANSLDDENVRSRSLFDEEDDAERDDEPDEAVEPDADELDDTDDQQRH